jgi:hypothetical protein
MSDIKGDLSDEDIYILGTDTSFSTFLGIQELNVSIVYAAVKVPLEVQFHDKLQGMQKLTVDLLASNHSEL